MPQVDPPPPEDELEKRREPKYIIDPKSVKPVEDARIRAWFASVMTKNEHRLSDKWQHREIVWTESIKPEDVDIQQVYPYPDLHYVIYRDRNLWSIMLMSQRTMLAKSSFARI